MGAYTGKGRRKGAYSSGRSIGKPDKGSGPSVLSRVMDILSRGNYAVAESVRRAGGESGSRKGLEQIDPDVLKGFWAGLSGKKKTTFQDLVPQMGVTRGTNNKLLMGAEGFLYDVLLDPTNLLGIGIAKTPGRLDDAADVVRGAGKADDGTRLADRVSEVLRSSDDQPPVKTPDVPSTKKVSPLLLDRLAARTPDAPTTRAADDVVEQADELLETPIPKTETQTTLELIDELELEDLPPAMAKAIKEAKKLMQKAEKAKAAEAAKISDSLSATQKIADQAGTPAGPKPPPVGVPYGPPVGPLMPPGLPRAKRIIDELTSGMLRPEAQLPPGIRVTPTGKLKDAKSGMFVSPKIIKPVPTVPSLGLGPLPSKVIAATAKASKAPPSPREVAAMTPTLFDEPLSVPTRTPPSPPEPVPRTVPEPPLTGTTTPGLTDRGAPVSRALELRVGNKAVISSTKGYEALAKALKPVNESEFVRLLSQTFRTGHGILPEVHNLQRIYSGRGRQRVADKVKEIHKIYEGVKEGPVTYPRVNVDGQKKIFDAIQKNEVHLLPMELKIPAQYTQVELAKIGAPTGAEVLPGMAGAVRFEEIPIYKGADRIFDRAPQAFIAQYDKAIRKQVFEEFRKVVETRFPADSPEMVANIKKARDVFGVEGETSTKWLHFMNSVQGPWKRWVTSYRPGFHIRNMLGDSFNAYLAGTNPSRFRDSALVLARGRGEDAAKGRIKIGGETFDPTEVEHMYRKAGLETSFIETEVVGGSQRGIAHAVTQFGEQREKFTRMATFIDSMDRARRAGRSIDTAMEEAAFRVRKYHFDYTDLTPSERKIRSFIPFYTYTRKELPLLLEHTLTQPHKIVNTQKAGRAIETMLGVERDPDDPFPGIDGLLPEWMNDQQIIQRGNNQVFTPGLPTDMLNQLGPRSFIRQQAGGLAPLIKGPIELGTGKSFPLGYNLQRKDQSEFDMISRYLASYLPYGNLARNSQSDLRERLLNILTGAGSRTVR